ncbi:TRAP transporter permease [Dethiobacter alkaliphilus]|uniref:TRAP transporter permease n=1 Tax=Dethiobacter alkaliphilus TaxID=427926 RepID=UPI002228081E|nr:TRAP transporter permease [Dethiobacter alkaliphilus]MCW3489558.1 TRAP transporter permease [Dethiobacter alkaliphilus]
MTKDFENELDKKLEDKAPETDLPMELAPDTEAESSNQRVIPGIGGKILFFYAAFVSLFHIYILNFRPMEQLLFRNYHLLLLGILGFAFFPGWAKAKSKIHWSDYLGMAGLVAVAAYLIQNFARVQFVYGTARATDLDMWMSLLGIILVIELARRTSGNSLPILALIFLIYPFVGQYLPGIFETPEYSAKRILTYLFTTNGVFSAPIAISSRYIVLFIIFSAFLTVSGVGTYFVEFAFAVSGFARGGPAKVAVLSSALMGMMNGTSAGNVVATGSLSIPLMKKVGYTSTFAAATEAVASTGGQIMPPIMGAGVFIMAEITNIRYERIMVAGILPALLYFFSAYMMVDYEAIKLKLHGVPRHLLPSITKTLRKAYLFIPVIVLIYSLLSGYSIIRAGFWGIVSSFLVSLIAKETRMGPKEIFEALEKGARGSVQLMSVCAAAGIIMGVIALTGIGARFANVLLTIADTNLLLALFFTMCVCILLGMGMPTTAAYAVAASVMAPGLVRITIDNPMFAHIPSDIIRLMPHMFVFYFACVSAITPPVALAAYAGAGISGSDPMRTGVMSFRLGIASYIVPYMFFFAPEILGIGAPAMIALRTTTALLGILALSSMVQSYFFGHLVFIQRILLLVAAFSLVSPNEIFDALGIGLMVLVFLSHRLPFIKEKAQEVEEQAAEGA